MLDIIKQQILTFLTLQLWWGGETSPGTVSYTHLDVYKRQFIYYALLNDKFNKINKNQSNNIYPPLTNINCNKERKILSELRLKLSVNHALVTKADKGNTVVIMDMTEYDNKIQDFIVNNNINKLNSDPTEHYVKRLNQSINKCTHLLTSELEDLWNP